MLTIDVTEFEYLYLGEGIMNVYLRWGQSRSSKRVQLFPTEMASQSVMPVAEKSECM